MKKRITLTLDKSTIEALRVKGHRRNTSMSAEVDRAVKVMQEETGIKEGPSPFMKWAGKFADWFTKDDFEANDPMGEELRNTESYQLMKKRLKSA
ncbi:MAG: hypothetical protein JST38_02605 [Bacteroidetes bacterium]|nr:hypothetical protein [Bacteroidota bacterium]MBS1939752.1 hypothetical protein [Bacteroidota bacterium]